MTLQCKNCKLCDNIKLHPSIGITNEIMIVGQNPARKLNINSTLIFGGHVINDKINNTIGSKFVDIFRKLNVVDKCYFTNLVKCSTDNNKISLQDINNCKHILIQEIRSCKPKKIIALGNIVYSSLLNIIPEDCISKLYKIQHPNYVFRYKSKEISKYIEEIRDIVK